MRFYPLAKNLGKVLLFALITVIIYLQLLLIWAQAEIGLRQHVLFSAQFDPSFDAKLRNNVNLFVRNTSKNPAYNIMVGRMMDEQNKAIPPNNWKGKVSSYFIGSLAPEQEVLLCSFTDKDFFKNKAIEVSYTNQFGDWKEIYIRLLEDERLLFIPKEVQKPGILLNTFEDLPLFLKLIRYERHLKSQRQSRLRASKMEKGKGKKKLK